MPDSINLLMTDLPGLIRFSQKDDGSNRVERIENIARNYAKTEDSIILAITEARTVLYYTSYHFPQ